MGMTFARVCMCVRIRMLYAFSQAHQDLWCSYLVAGQTKQDSYAIAVVPSTELEGSNSNTVLKRW